MADKPRKEIDIKIPHIKPLFHYNPKPSFKKSYSETVFCEGHEEHIPTNFEVIKEEIELKVEEGNVQHDAKFDKFDDMMEKKNVGTDQKTREDHSRSSLDQEKKEPEAKQPDPIQLSADDRTKIEEMASSLFKRFMIGFVISAFFYLVLLLTEREVFPFHVFFALAIALKIGYIGYTIKNVGFKQLWTRENQFKTLFLFELFCVLLFEVMSIVKLEEVDFPLIIFACLGLVTLVVYCVFSLQQQKHHALYLVLRLIFWVQLLFVALKADEFVEWSWQGALWTLWFVSGFVALYSFLLFITLLFLSTLLCSKEVKKVQVVGLLWIFLVSAGQGAACLLMLVGIANRMEIPNEDEDDKFVMCGLILGLAHFVFVFFFSVLTKKTVTDFLSRGFESEVISEKCKEANSKKEGPFMIEKDPGEYLVKFSNNCFLKVKDVFKNSDKQRIETLKQDISTALRTKHRRNSIKKNQLGLYRRKKFESGNLELKSKQFKDPRALRHAYTVAISDDDPKNQKKMTSHFSLYPEDEVKEIGKHQPPLGRIIENPFEEIIEHESNEAPKTKKPASIVDVPKIKKVKRCQSMIELDYCKHLDENQDLLRGKHLGLTDDDIDIADIFERDHFFGVFSKQDKDFDLKNQLKEEKEQKKEKEETLICTQCKEREAHSVCMPCGHGGLCYPCALKNWRHHDLCHICNKPIDYVLELDYNFSSKLGVKKIFKKIHAPQRKPQFDDYKKSFEHDETFSILANHTMH